MQSKITSKPRRSIGESSQEFCSNIRQSVHSFGRFIYNRKHQEILGRDGKRWSKLAAFYFFFYITLGGFFCLYLAVFMAFLPMNRPRYIGKDSRLTSRGYPLSPGLSCRPQTSPNQNDAQTFISLSTSNGQHQKRSNQNNSEVYTKNLDDFFQMYNRIPSSNNFNMTDENDCHSNNQYGFRDGKPCILIKMNKLVGFIPEIGRTDVDNAREPACPGISNLPVQCTGENPLDQDMLGDVMYYSESGSNNVCGSIHIKHFPYTGKDNQNDVYQAPYVWAQFTNITPHVLISVECRIFGGNIFYDRIAQRACILMYIGQMPYNKYRCLLCRSIDVPISVTSNTRLR